MSEHKLDSTGPSWDGRAREGAFLLFAWSLPLSLFGMQTGTGLMMVGVVLSAALGRFRPRPSPLDLPLALLLLAVLLSLLFGGRPASFRSATSWWVMCSYFLVWFVLNRATPQILPRAAEGLVLLAVLAAVLGIFQAVSGKYPAFELMHAGMDPSKRLVPISNQPAAVGFFFSRLTFAHVMLFPLCWAAAFALQREAGKKRAFYGAAFAIIAAAIFATQARAAWLAGLLAAAALVFWRSSRRQRLWLAGILAVLAVVVLAIPGPGRRLLGSFSQGKDWTRLAIWYTALELARENPLTGVGYGNFGQAARPRLEKRAQELGWKQFRGVVAWAHSDYLTWLAECGLLGLAAFCLLFVCYFVRLWRGQKALAPWPAAFARGSAAAVGAFLFCGLFHDNFFDGEVAFCLWFTMAASLAACGSVSVEKQH